ncbi:MAG TPA: ribonuclease Z [Salinimicrobium sp.]|nr:ribonuclease Z [Salinimicrobium sp.]
MKVTEKDFYLILEDEKNEFKGFVKFLNDVHDQYKGHHLVIDILKYGTLSLEELLMFLEISNRHRKAKKSFVIANDTINIDHVPEELVVVPTLQEAEDIIQMEEIERDLGF